MKAIVSVFAKDSKGITAYVTSLLAQKEINILDISQTLMQEYFLKEKGEERALDIHIQRQDIFEAMHRI